MENRRIFDVYFFCAEKNGAFHLKRAEIGQISDPICWKFSQNQWKSRILDYKWVGGVSFEMSGSSYRIPKPAEVSFPSLLVRSAGFFFAFIDRGVSFEIGGTDRSDLD